MSLKFAASFRGQLLARAHLAQYFRRFLILPYSLEPILLNPTRSTDSLPSFREAFPTADVIYRNSEQRKMKSDLMPPWLESSSVWFWVNRGPGLMWCTRMCGMCMDSTRDGTVGVQGTRGTTMVVQFQFIARVGWFCRVAVARARADVE